MVKSLHYMMPIAYIGVMGLGDQGRTYPFRNHSERMTLQTKADLIPDLAKQESRL